jgi:organic hydroperoxide reductase OsmC/OhrA
MAQGTHHYTVKVSWTGNLGSGTKSYRAYSRDHVIDSGTKPTIFGSSDPAFLGDAGRWNPEDLLVASVSACHKLWYLHLCCDAGVTVLSYVDDAVGRMVEDAAKGGFFTEIVLRPLVTIDAKGSVETALALHHAAHEKCFIANSLNFPIRCEPQVSLGV